MIKNKRNLFFFSIFFLFSVDSDANKNLEKIIEHIDSQTGESAIQREVQMKLLEQRVKDLEKNVTYLKNRTNLFNKVIFTKKFLPCHYKGALYIY